MSATTQFTTNAWIRIISVTGRGSNQPGRPTRHSAAGFMWVFNSPAPRMDFADRRCQTCSGCRRPVCRAGRDEAMGLPIGVLITGRRFREDACLEAAEAIEARVGPTTPIDPVRQSVIRSG
jgi:hypothetical protein